MDSRVTKRTSENGVRKKTKWGDMTESTRGSEGVFSGRRTESPEYNSCAEASKEKRSPVRIRMGRHSRQKEQQIQEVGTNLEGAVV